MLVIINFRAKNEVNFLYSVDTFEDKLSAGFILFIFHISFRTVLKKKQFVYIFP